MGDVSEFFKSGLLGLYKNTIGKNYQQKTLKDRVNNFNNMRRETRNTLILQKRQIDNMTPINTPEPSTSNVKKISEVKDVKKPSKRLEMLHKWKLEKEKRKQEEKEKAKPLFKVCHVPVEVGLPNLNNVNRHIKGKPIKASIPRSQSQFAPPNHSFHAPKAIKPIHMISAKTLRPGKSNVDLLKIKSPSNSLEENKLSSRVTRKEVPPQRNTRAATRSRQDKVMQTDNKSQVKLDINKKIITPVDTKQKTKCKNVKSKTQGTALHEKVENSSVSSNNVTNRNATNFSTKTSKSNKGKSLTTSKKILNKSQDAEKSSSEDEVFPKKHADAKRLTKSSQKPVRKIVGWNHVEVVGEEGSSTDIKTPKTIQRKYNKTPGKGHKFDMRFDTSVAELTEECNTNVKVSNSVPKNVKKVKRRLSKNQELKNVYRLEPIEYDKSQDSTVGYTSGSASPDYPIDKNLTEVNLNSSFQTPQKNNVREESPVYVSPFVTVSRGKNSARKEYHIRHSSGSLTPEFDINILNNTSPKVGADYFLKKLNNEINRIESVYEIWDNYKNSNDLSEEANDMINVAVGQSKLLISKKFEQFRNLIDQCRNCEYVEKPITCEDLHGFWDMIYMQVEDLNKRFNNLDQLKANNWQEIIPEKKVIVKRGRGRPKKGSASTALKNLIKTARSTKKSCTENENLNTQVDEVKVFDGGYYSVNSPIRVVNEPQVMKGSGRRSLRVSLLTNQAKNRMSSSPGLAMMKISQAIKYGDGLTPGKSILKNDLTKSEKRITKSVLFKDDNLEEDIEAKFVRAAKESNGDLYLEKENDVNEINLITFSPVTPTRRSKRLSKLK